MACLWKAGYAISDPGFSFYHPELRMFDPVSQEGRQLLYAFTEGLSGGCDDSCQVHSHSGLMCFDSFQRLWHNSSATCGCFVLPAVAAVAAVGCSR